MFILLRKFPVALIRAGSDGMQTVTDPAGRAHPVKPQHNCSHQHTELSVLQRQSICLRVGWLDGGGSYQVAFCIVHICCSWKLNKVLFWGGWQDNFVCSNVIMLLVGLLWYTELALKL